MTETRDWRNSDVETWNEIEEFWDKVDSITFDWLDDYDLNSTTYYVK